MSIISIPRISDNYLMKVFVDEVLKNHHEYGLSESTIITVNLYGASFTVSLTKGETEEDTVVSSTSPELLESLSNSSSNSIVNINFRDVSTNPYCMLTYSRTPNSFIDGLDFNQQEKPPHVVLIQQRIHAELLRHTDVFTSKGGSVEDNSFSAHHEVLTKLEGLNAHLIEKQHDYSRKLEQDKSDFIELNNKKYQDKIAELESNLKQKHEDIDSEYQEKNSKLKVREKAVLDADNTTTRRKTTTSMLTKVQEKAERFSFSSSVNERSFMTVCLCLLLMVSAVINSYMALSELDDLNYVKTSSSMKNDPITGSYISIAATKELRPTAEKPAEILWFLYVRIFLGSVLFITSTLYLIKWMNTWTDRIAQQELENQKFVRDLNRSHLTVEMCLEWNDKKDGPIPEQLLAAMTEGLFKDKVQTNTQINHPIDQLASALVKSADKIEFPLGNGNITTSGKAVSKAAASKQDIPKNNQVA